MRADPKATQSHSIIETALGTDDPMLLVVRNKQPALITPEKSPLVHHRENLDFHPPDAIDHGERRILDRPFAGTGNASGRADMRMPLQQFGGVSYAAEHQVRRGDALRRYVIDLLLQLPARGFGPLKRPYGTARHAFPSRRARTSGPRPWNTSVPHG